MVPYPRVVSSVVQRPCAWLPPTLIHSHSFRCATKQQPQDNSRSTQTNSSLQVGPVSEATLFWCLDFPRNVKMEDGCGGRRFEKEHFWSVLLEVQDAGIKLWCLSDSSGHSQFISSQSTFRVTKSESDVEEKSQEISDQSLCLEGCKKQHVVLALKLRNSHHKLIVSQGCAHGKRRKSVGRHHTMLRWRKSRAEYVHLIKTARVWD